MNVPAILNSPFMQVALPIMVTFAIATWYQSKRVDDLRLDMSKRMDDLRSDMIGRFDEVNRRFDRLDESLKEIRNLLATHDQRIARLEERTSPVRM